MLSDKPWASVQDLQNEPQDESAVVLRHSFVSVPPISGDGGHHYSGGDNDGDKSDACLFVETVLAAYLDNELTPEQTDLINAHLTNCTNCADELAAMQASDTMIQREWRDYAPLPSSSQRVRCIDAIMEALPAAAPKPTVFAPKRIHSKARWMRFSNGLVGLLLLAGTVVSSYLLGIAQGMQQSNDLGKMTVGEARSLRIPAYRRRSPAPRTSPDASAYRLNSASVSNSTRVANPLLGYASTTTRVLNSTGLIDKPDYRSGYQPARTAAKSSNPASMNAASINQAHSTNSNSVSPVTAQPVVHTAVNNQSAPVQILIHPSETLHASPQTTRPPGNPADIDR